MRGTRVALIIALLVASTGLALPASAAVTVTTVSELQDAATTCPSDDTAVLGTDIDAAGTTVIVDCDLTIDLAGFDLDVNSVDITSGHHLTITDTVGGGVLTATSTTHTIAGIHVPASSELTISGNATVNATAGYYAAGIGGGQGGDGGTVTISDNAVVEATGSDFGAGIGGGEGGDGGTVTISDNAIVEATGGPLAAGIGGSYLGDGAAVTISGNAIVEATGGTEGAGIGGGLLGYGGTVTISDNAIVEATGGPYAAGIGGSYLGDGAAVTISGNAIVEATGGTEGAGIGGGLLGDGGAVTIGENATVTASGDSSAIGPGTGSTEFGTVEVAGTLHLPTGVVSGDFDAGSFTVTATGRVLGVSGNETIGAMINGPGTIVNHGVIALSEPFINTAVTITHHNYLVSLDTQGGTNPDPVRVFGPSFDVSYRTLPTAPAGAAWNTAADGSGTWFDATTTMTGDTTVYAAVLVATDLDLSAPTLSVDEGDSVTFTVTATDQLGNPIATDGVVLTSSVDTDIIDGLTVTFPTASDHTITATMGDATASLIIEVIPAPAEDILPETGPSNVMVFGGASLLLISAGIGLIWYSHQRRRTPDKAEPQG